MSTRKPSMHVFPWLVNNAAFIDRIVLSVDGVKLKPDFKDEFKGYKNWGISRGPSLYSRIASGESWPSGNSVEIVYGRRRRFKNVPIFQVRMHSVRIPLTAAQVRRFIHALASGFPRIHISLTELTFDVTGTSIDYVLSHLIHRAQKEARVLSDGKRKTIYVGSSRSAWQVRIYQKTREVVRLEFVLRRAFLSKHQINEPEDLLLLRKLNVWRSISIKRSSASGSAVRHTALQKKLETMQRHFVW